MELRGPRVTLRRMAEADRPAFAALNADSEVMRHFPAPLSRVQSDVMFDRIALHHERHGFGFCGVWSRDSAVSAIPPQGIPLHPDGSLIGMVGLGTVPFAARFAPNVELSWRLVPGQQGRGLAGEAARLALADGFGRLGLPEIVAWTVEDNAPSWRLMERLGMQADGEFEEPRQPEGTRFRFQRLWRLRREAWARSPAPPASGCP